MAKTPRSPFENVLFGLARGYAARRRKAITIADIPDALLRDLGLPERRARSSRLPHPLNHHDAW